ncbi:MAG: YHS domain-containing (seleno)protein [Cellvibrionaceae bacterium]
MKNIKTTILSTISAFIMIFALNASADFVTNSTVGAGGYDLVSYQTGKKPLPGNGNFVSTVDNVNYIFSNKENLDTFNKNKDKYLPQYGGYCAYGAFVGKKFIGDPNVWEVVDGKLYFNLDNNVKSVWVKDIPGHIEGANKQWKKIKNISAAEL